jgi:hypothetical protein
VVSPLSFLEVFNSLAHGGERYVIPNLKRLEALSPFNPRDPAFLEMPGQFVLREMLGSPPVLVDTYQPRQMAEAMVTALRHRSMSAELRDWLAEISNNHQSGTANYADAHDKIRSVQQMVPDRELWLRAKMRHLGILHLSDEEVRKLGIALDAAYEYATSIRRQLANPSYLPAREPSAWADYQQLFYLAARDVHMLFADGDFIGRTGGSRQQSRCLRLSDVIAEVTTSSTTA